MRLLFLTAALSLLLAACSTPFPLKVEADSSPAARRMAEDLLDRSIRAHGNDPYKTAGLIAVSFDGEWGTVAKRIQPDLTDPNFRVASSEVFDLRSENVSQSHRGPGGTKAVVRTADDVVVTRNGVVDTDPAARETAGLVADAYRMFLTSPAYLRERGVPVSLMADAEIEGKSYNRIRATLKPGFGFSKSDELIYWIDPKTAVLKRVSFTIEGYAPTRGSHVTVDFLEHIERSGTLYPSAFKETVLAPVRIVAHEWETTELEVR